jgi:hypothetical protein
MWTLQVKNKLSNGKQFNVEIEYEFTSANPAQQNHQVDVSGGTIESRVRAMLYRANVPQDKRYFVLTSLAKFITQLDGLIVETISEKAATRYEHGVQNLRSWESI